MYKRRRLAQPALPGSPEDVDSVLLSTRFTNLNGAPFYCGLSNPDDSRSSPIFSSREQLELLKEANHVYFDVTCKVVHSIYQELFNIFTPCCLP